MGPLMLGLIAVGLAIGMAVGRTSERARRGVKDYSAGKTALTKYRQVALAEIRKAAVVILIVGVVMLALFLGAMKTR
jgi:hypothetical protein